MKKKDKFDELACDFKNEDDCKEDMDEENLDDAEVEVEHFEEKDALKSGEVEE